MDDKPNFGWGAEISNNEKTDDFQKVVAAQNFFISSYLVQILKFYRRNLHNIAYIQILNPLSLVQKP